MPPRGMIAQASLRQSDAPPAPQSVPPGPKRIEDVVPGMRQVPDQPENVYELNFSTALAMAAGQNPQVAFAEERYREAYARLTQARVLWLPSIRGGVSWNKHDGPLQPTDGDVTVVSRSSMYAGLGAQTIGAGTLVVPGVLATFHLADAIFQPKIANRIAAAQDAAQRSTTNDVLLEAAVSYLDLLRTMQQQAITQQTLADIRALAQLTDSYARTGQGLQADADRVQAEVAVRTNEVVRAEEAMQMAMARLNEALSMDPGMIAAPLEPTIVPIELVSPNTPPGELISIGLDNRPELDTSRHLVGEAIHRYRRERFAPLLPSMILATSYGGYGGGTGSSLENFGGRVDIDAVAYWELRNLGFGDMAAKDATAARVDQARYQEIRQMDLVAREITQAHVQVQARRRQIAVAETGLKAAAESHERNLKRIREAQGLPIEVLQSIQALDQARREYLRTVFDYNDAQFRLQRALGWPIR